MPGKGYRGIGPEQGNEIKAVDAYSYAIFRCVYGPEREEFKERLVEWLYSGHWVPEEEED